MFICNSHAQPAIYCLFCALPPLQFCFWWRELTSKPEAPKHAWLGVIIFGSVRFLTTKNNQISFFFFEKINRNRTETESNRLVSVRSGSVLDFKKPRKPICSYFFSNSSVRCLFTTIVFPALCKRIKSQKSTPLISSQIRNSAINQNPKFQGTGNLDFHRSHRNWALHYSTQNAKSWSKQAKQLYH